MAKRKGGKQKAKPKSKQELPRPTQYTKQPESKINLDPDVSSEVITAALSSVNSLVLLKVCRLCENKYGPFLNIFDAEKTTAKKIDTLMPFTIAENDELPHKICYRCSAKVEELHEFVQKCTETQVNLRKEIGLKEPLVTKKKTCKIWADNLNKSNMSNDDICDAIIRKAMEGIKDIPLDVPIDDTKQPENKTEKRIYPKRDRRDIEKQDESNTDALPAKKLKIENNTVNQSENQKVLRSSYINTEESLKNGVQPKKTITPTDTSEKAKTVPTTLNFMNNEPVDVEKHDIERNKKIEPSKGDNTEIEEKFNIMNHITMIKVNGVGLLFQCKLCNRNFLKKEVVLSHGCAKKKSTQGVITKEVSVKNVAPIEIPKVKYINTRTIPKPIVIGDNTPSPTYLPNPTPTNDNSPISMPTVTKPLKPKIGPASKVKSRNEEVNAAVGMSVSPKFAVSTTPASIAQSLGSDIRVNFPSIPNVNGRYKIVPGPNNSLMLVEDTSAPPPTTDVSTEDKKSEANPEQAVKQPIKIKNTESPRPSISNVRPFNNASEQAISKDPYPVGFFQTPKPPSTEPETFKTPAVKQSYTIVQTGHPSKLLISTKPQTPAQKPLNKKQKKLKPEEVASEPNSDTPQDPKNNGIFTFINVDPLLQPSYVLPTNNIIQESQISTSSSPNKNTPVKDTTDSGYTCNLCSENFTREKKLLTHIQSHYNKMDQEDMRRNESLLKKRGKKT